MKKGQGVVEFAPVGVGQLGAQAVVVHFAVVFWNRFFRHFINRLETRIGQRLGEGAVDDDIPPFVIFGKLIG